MFTRQNRMAPEHAGAGIPHHLFDFFPHVRLVAMHGAFGAPGFILPERTFLQPLFYIGQKPAAFRAKVVFTAVVATAVKINHDSYGVEFRLHF